MLKPLTVTIEHVSPQVPREWGGRLDVMEVWPQLQRSFRKAQRYGLGDRTDEVAILRHLCEGSMELLIARQEDTVLGGIILQFVERPRGRACVAVAAMFDRLDGLPDWTPAMTEHLAEYAKAQGCYCVETNARDGIVPVLERLGWRRKATVMELDNGR